jgi:flagellar basal body-associated protein FliL
VFCKQCGTKNEEGSRFCEFCGTKLAVPIHKTANDSERSLQDRVYEDTEETLQDRAYDDYDKTLQGGAYDDFELSTGYSNDAYKGKKTKRKKKRKLFIILFVVLLLVAVLIAGWIFMGIQSTRAFNDAVNEGNRYLLAENLEQAEARFLRAIEINPREVEPYLRLADIYVEQEEIDKAIEILEQGQEAVAEEDRYELEQREEEIRDNLRSQAGGEGDEEDDISPQSPESDIEEEEDELFPGVIAIVTNTIDWNEEEFRSAEALVNRYGADKVIHRTWDAYSAIEAEMITILTEIASNLDVGAIVINQAFVNTNAAIDAVREIRGDDIFIVVASAAEDPAEVYARVDLSLDINNQDLAELFVQQAVEMGAEAIAHYSFPRHMSIPMLAARRDNMQHFAEEAGLRFYDLSSPDPMEEGMAASQLFISLDVGRQVEELGVNTAFFATNCGQQIPLLQQVLAYGAMYIQPCCPSPFHVFPQALGLATEGEEAVGLFTVAEIIELTTDAIIEADMQGRLSNWALPGSMAYTTVGFWYAIEWLNGRVPQEVGYVDEDVLLELFGDYAEEVLGERMYPRLTQLQIGADTFSTMYVILMPYIVY